MAEAIQSPRIVIGGAASNSGKTTAAVALIRALRNRGLTVAPFKCGPDYLDPTYHARAAGRPSHNLDGWMMGREACVATFRRCSQGADIAVIEGVMGLFDGASPRGESGSTAEMAKWLGAPLVAAVDASGMSRTIAALALGLAGFDRDLNLAGLLGNRVGSRGHLQLLREALEPEKVALLGGLPKRADLAFPASASPSTRPSTSTTRTTSRGWSRWARAWSASRRCAPERSRTCTVSSSAVATRRSTRALSPTTPPCALS
jgi:cobyrinic acid a,c-diamide synthase